MSDIDDLLLRKYDEHPFTQHYKQLEKQTTKTKQTNKMTQEIDPLTQAAGSLAEPKFPLLAPGRIYRFSIASCKRVPVKADPNKHLLEITLSTENDYTDEEGGPLRKGFKGYHRIGLNESETTNEKRGRSRKNIAEDLGMVLKACGIKDKSPMDLINNPQMVEGQVVDCNVGITPAKNNFPASNNYKFILPT